MELDRDGGREMKAIGIKGRLITSFAVVLVLVAAGLVPLMLANLGDTIERAEERELRGYRQAVDAALATSSASGAAMAKLVANIPEVQAAFANGDRQRLADLFAPGFQVMKAEAGVDQFQFHTAPATSFLRVHMPAKFGDDLSSFRQTVIETNAKQRAILGLENGVGGMGVRAVVPMTYQGRHTGSVEFGMSFSQAFTASFKEQFGVEVGLHAANPAVNSASGKAAKDDFITIGTTLREPFFTKAERKQALGGDTIIRRNVIGGVPVAALLAPVPDYSGAPAAVVEIVMDSSEYAAQYTATRNQALAMVAGVLTIGMVIAFFLARSISAPLVGMTATMRRLAGGDLNVEVPSTKRGDEVGDMARAVEVFKHQGMENRALVEQQEITRAEAEAERRNSMLRIADGLDTSVGRVAETVGSASSEMMRTAESMSRMVEQAESRAAAVAAASEEASANVATVAAATEELTSSITEISRQTAESTRIANEAVKGAQTADHRIGDLSKAVVKIGEVVQFITDIASQTNLLALNATIEAARAGEAGKGFAVVASEVKNLANQTTKATEEISVLINAVQTATTGAVGAIDSIGEVINRMSGVITTIASAIEEQGAATQEISRNVQQAAEGTRQVSDNIAGVSTVVNETGRAAESVLTAGTDLASQADTLRIQVRESVADIRCA